MPGKERPRNYHPLDLDFYRQASVQDLLDGFGHLGPAVLLLLIAEAHRQAHAGPRAAQGEVDIPIRQLVREARSDTARIGEVLVALVDGGLLEFLAPVEGRLHGRLLKWERWEVKDAQAAERKRRSRAE